MFRNEPTNELTWDNRSIFWSSYPEQDSELWMCADDLGTAVWWCFDNVEKNFDKFSNIPIRLENCSEILEKILIKSIPYRGYSEDLLGALSGFSQIVAQTLVLKGGINFEIGAGWNQKSKPAKVESANLSYIPTKSLIRIGLQVFQVVPANANFDELPARVIKLDPKRIISFKPPIKWRNILTQIRKQLPLIKQSQLFWMNECADRNSTEDFKAVNRKYNIQFAHITAPIGWNGRSLFHDEMADFQSTIRELQWQRFCIDIRNEILRTLNDAFKKIGQLCNETPQLVWEQLPTTEQVDDALQLIMDGKTNFGDILKSLRGF
jgi:hypothetical protein